MNKLLILFLTLLIVIIDILFLKFLFIPWIWIFSLSILTLLLLVILLKNNRLKIVFSYCLAILSALLITELYLYLKLNPVNIISSGTATSNNYQQLNDNLGYSPIPGISRTLIKRVNNDTIYNVTYTFDTNALRVTKSSNEKASKNLLFFGGSYTFGEGVSDNENWPYFTGLSSKQKFTIYNFGFQGYGPHQMLSRIENTKLESIIDTSKESIVIYSFITDHIRRSAGFASWDYHGPKYTLKNREAVYNGNFDSNTIGENIIVRRMIQQLSKSLLFNALFKRENEITTSDEDLLFAIVKKSKLLLKQRYNISRFIILIWDPHHYATNNQREKTQSLIKRFAEINIENYLVSDAIKDYEDYKELYSISKYDTHPNAFAYKELAHFLNTIL